MNQKFYAFEGIDGCGKTTMIKFASDYLIEKAIPHVVVEAYPRDPDSLFLRDLWINQKVPSIANVAIILELRRRVVVDQILPALKEGKVILSDRWHGSTIAYNEWGMDLRNGLMDRMFNHFNNEVLKELVNYPDSAKMLTDMMTYSTVYMGIDIPTSRERSQKRRACDAFEKSGEYFFQKVLHGYEYHNKMREEIGNDVYRIDAQQSVESVQEQIRNVFKELVKR